MKILIALKNGNALETEVPDDMQVEKLFQMIQESTANNFMVFPNSIVNINEICFFHMIKEQPIVEHKKEPTEVIDFGAVR